jgi:hypothetical protein
MILTVCLISSAASQSTVYAHYHEEPILGAPFSLGQYRRHDPRARRYRGNHPTQRRHQIKRHAKASSFCAFMLGTFLPFLTIALRLRTTD